jgi:F-type H+-transporting ATPase subunit delta
MREPDVANDDISMASVPGRYASALYDLASTEKSQAAVEADLVRFQALIDGSPDLEQLVSSPVVSQADQSRAIGALLDKAGIQGTASNFIRLLAKNRRMMAIEDVIKSYRAIAARARGEATVEVTSAVPLSEAQTAELRKTLAASVGKSVQLTSRVDPAILGGLIVKIGSRMIDSSIRTKLNSLKTRMKEAN